MDGIRKILFFPFILSSSAKVDEEDDGPVSLSRYKRLNVWITSAR